MKHSHRLFIVLIMLSMILGLFSMPAFSGGDVARAQEGNPPPAPHEVQWELGFTNLDSELLSQSESVVGRLATEGVAVNQLTDRVQFSGSDEMSAMRAMMFDNIAPLDFLGGVVEMTVYLPAEGELDLVLEARVATGYRWEVVSVEGVAVEASEPKYQQYYPGVGAPSLETIHIQGPAGTAVQLLYRRSFDQEEPTHASLSIKLSEDTAVLELSDPTPPALITEEEIDSSRSTSSSAPSTDLLQAKAFPAALDWRTSGIVPPVRSQGAYGSCWAFGTVSIMESAIAKAGGQLTDLSEQFLISCNKDNWGDGGLTAHKYHYNTLGVAQSIIGAVLETDKPYSASKGTCITAYNHPYQLTDWKFITGSEWTMPTVDQIKNAIYTYGPVTAGVCVDNGWNGYTGGVYSPSAGLAASECGGYTNHQIVLVGWDDATQTWILRNSWGSGWGDDGYMHIKWDAAGNTSRVGEGSSWVTLALAGPAPAATSLLAPAVNSLIKDPTPELSWNSTVGASTYEIQISTSSTFSGADLLDAGASTSYSPLSDLIQQGKWYWRVRGKNSTGTTGTWSAARYFMLDTDNPDAPILKAPLTGAKPNGTPTFSWTKPAGSPLRYQFQYNTTNSVGDDDPASVTFRSPELKLTAYKPPVAMPMVEYYWFARARDAAGNWSDWSAPFTVTVQPLNPLPPVLVAPKSGSYTNDTTPELTWKSVLYAAAYQVQVSLSSKFIDAPVLDSDTPTSYVTDPLTPDGKYYWRVRATNENLVSGKWSAASYFILDTDNPDAPVLKSPLTGAKPNGTPTFSWTKPAGSPLRYQFQYNTTNSVGDDDPASVTFRSPELKLTTYKPPVAMPMVEYYWFVRAKDATGNWSDWSAPFMVEVQPLKPSAPALSLPANKFKTDVTTPSLSWRAVAYGYSYEIQVDDNAKFLSPNYTTDPRVSGLSDTTDELVPGKYYWRVRAWNEAGASGSWSAVRYFTILPR